jgi:Cytochrome P460
MRSHWKTGLLIALAAVVFEVTRLPSGESRLPLAEPQYNEKGELKRPADYRGWVFVGSNIGLQYRKDVSETGRPEKERGKEPGDFHNVYINREAYEHYRRTGKFPDPTMLVMDVYEAKEKEPKNIVSRGLFPGNQLHIEMAVKNSRRPDGSKTDWAYYAFGTNQATAKAFPDSACYQCHLKHAEDDNVWVQFYPSLRMYTKTRDH